MMKRPSLTIALGCVACFYASGAAQALIIDSDVELDGLTGRYAYGYTLQNASAPADGVLITSFSLPFFGDPGSALIADSIEAPAFWAFDLVSPSLTSWPYVRGDDTAAGSYQPFGIDYTDPDFIVRFSLNPPQDIGAFLGAISQAQARLIICSIGDRCSEEELAGLSATIEAGNQWEAALVDGAESLSGFAFASLLAPTVGPGLIITNSGAASYSAPFLPLSYDAPGPAPVPEPSTLLLFGTAVCVFVAAHRRKRDARHMRLRLASVNRACDATETSSVRLIAK